MKATSLHDPVPTRDGKFIRRQAVKIKSEKDFWSGVIFFVVGVGFAWGATNYSFGTSGQPGPGYFPFGLGILMAIIGALVLLKSLTGKHDGGDRIGKASFRPLVIVVGAVALFGWVLPHLGMFIALPLLTVTAALAGDEFHLGEALLNAAVLTLGNWVIFIWGLNLVIPLWPSFVGP